MAKEYIITEEQIQKIANFVGKNICQQPINESWVFFNLLRSLPEIDKENKKEQTEY